MEFNTISEAHDYIKAHEEEYKELSDAINESDNLVSKSAIDLFDKLEDGIYSAHQMIYDNGMPLVDELLLTIFSETHEEDTESVIEFLKDDIETRKCLSDFSGHYVYVAEDTPPRFIVAYNEEELVGMSEEIRFNGGEQCLYYKMIGDDTFRKFIPCPKSIIESKSFDEMRSFINNTNQFMRPPKYRINDDGTLSVYL